MFVDFLYSMYGASRAYYVFFFFNDTATTEIYTRSLVGSVKMCIRDSGTTVTNFQDRSTELDLGSIQISSFGEDWNGELYICLLYTSPSPRDRTRSRMPSSA